MITLDEFKEKAITRVAVKLDVQKNKTLHMDRDAYIDYINGLINGYELTKGVVLKKEVRQELLADIMIESGVMAEVLV